MAKLYDSIIVGAGPAGMTAALYLLRAGKSVLLLEHNAIGGQIAESPRLENYPSIASISGNEFASNLYDQIDALGAELEFSDVQKIEKTEEGFVLTDDYDVAYEGKTVILATGCHHRKLGLEREEELTGHGISYCATCDGAFFQGEDVVVIGDANSALQYAIALAATSKHVQVVTLFDKYFADPVLVQRMESIPNIDAVHNFNAVRFEGDVEIEGVTFESTETHEPRTFPCKGVFIAIGQIPDNDRYGTFVDLEKGFILTDEAMATKTPGIFAAGDCRKKSVRQVATAIGDGASAAMSALSYLNRK